MMEATISAKGWIVIPAEYRAKYNLKPGTRVSIVDYGGSLTIVRVPDDPIEASHGMLKGKESLTRVLLEEHRKERERDERRIARVHS
jgi:AbrB family looped-hinge helix DNA binding protein